MQPFLDEYSPETPVNNSQTISLLDSHLDNKELTSDGDALEYPDTSIYLLTKSVLGDYADYLAKEFEWQINPKVLAKQHNTK